MRLDGLLAVDLEDVLRAGRHHRDAIDLGANGDVVAGFAHGGRELEVAFLVPGDVHEQVDRSRRERDAQAQPQQAGMVIVLAVIVIFLAAEQALALVVARGH